MSNKFKKIIVWFNRNSQTYYYKVIHDIVDKYNVGYTNQYNHEVILVIDIYKDLIDKYSLKNKVINRLIRFLQSLQ